MMGTHLKNELLEERHDALWCAGRVPAARVRAAAVRPIRDAVQVDNGADARVDVGVRGIAARGQGLVSRDVGCEAEHEGQVPASALARDCDEARVAAVGLHIPPQPSEGSLAVWRGGAEKWGIDNSPGHFLAK